MMILPSDGACPRLPGGVGDIGRRTPYFEDIENHLPDGDLTRWELAEVGQACLTARGDPRDFFWQVFDLANKGRSDEKAL